MPAAMSAPLALHAAEPHSKLEDAQAPNAVDDFQQVLFSLLHMCRAGSVTSSAASSPREPRDGAKTAFSRDQSMLSEDLSTVPPEQPEWLGMAAAARSRLTQRSRSRPGSRRNSAYALHPLFRHAGTMPSPLRHSVSVVDVERVGLSSLAPVFTPEGGLAHPDACLLLERFGSCEGLSAAVEDFYRRLCADARTSATIQAVPEPNVRFTMMRLMAMTLEEGFAPSVQDRSDWLGQCQGLLRSQGVAGDVVYDVVLEHMAATVEELGVSADNMSWESDNTHQ